MMILGLDLSLRSAGWVVVETGTRIVLAHGVVERAIDNKLDFTEQTRRMLAASRVIASLLGRFTIDRVAYEGPTYSKFGRIFHLGGMHFVVMSQALLAAPTIEHVVIGPTQARLAVFGKGRHPKEYKNGKLWIRDQLRTMDITEAKPLGLDTGNEHSNDALVVALASHYLSEGIKQQGLLSPVKAPARERKKRQKSLPEDQKTQP